MNGLMAQSPQFEAWQQAVRKQFQTGGSTISLILIVLLLAALVALVILLSHLQSKMQRKTDGGSDYSDPQRLYAHLLTNLGLAVPQRQMLESVARDLRLPHPTTLLVSEQLFDQSVEKWVRSGNNSPARLDGETQSQLVARTKNRLFPAGMGMVFSTPNRE